MFEFLLGALAWMRPIEIERERVEKLQLLVILEQMILLDPARGLRIFNDLSFQLALPIDLASEHPLCQGPIHRRNFVDQDELRESVAPVVEAPTVHARHQPAVGMMPLVEI